MSADGEGNGNLPIIHLRNGDSGNNRALHTAILTDSEDENSGRKSGRQLHHAHVQFDETAIDLPSWLDPDEEFKPGIALTSLFQT